MPFYEFKCQNGHVTEQIRKYTETTIVCPECNAPANRLFPGKFVAHGLPNGHIAAPNTARRDYVPPNPNDKRIDPNIYRTKRLEE